MGWELSQSCKGAAPRPLSQLSGVHMKSSALTGERPLASEAPFPRALHGASSPDPGASEWRRLFVAAPFGGAASSGRGRLGPSYILAALGS